MKSTPNDIRVFIVKRCKERIKASQVTNRNVEKYNRAMELKYKLGNVLAPMLVCRFLLEHLEAVKDIIIVSAPYTHGHSAYVNKLAKLDDLAEFAQSYLKTGTTRGSIDTVIMRNTSCVIS